MERFNQETTALDGIAYRRPKVEATSKEMAMNESTVADVIETAIQREIEAHDFYMNIYDRVEDPSTKQTLEFIAGEEKKHREFLVRYRDGGYGAAALRMNAAVDYKLAEHLDEPPVQEDISSEKVYLIASHRELRSYQFYTGLAEMHPDGELNEILRKIASEELKHKEKMEYLYANTAFPQTDGG